MKPLKIQSRRSLAGVKYGVQFENKEDIYVSPAIYSLFKTDPDAIIKALRIKIVKPTRNAFKNIAKGG